MSADEITEVWAEEQVTALLPEPVDVPEYGSAAWLQLPAGDPRKAAAIITAAELWRRDRAREAWLDQLADDDPDQWFQIVTADANAYARSIAGDLARRLTNAELKARRQHRPPHKLHATPGWPPIAIPGQPGRYLVAQEAA